MRIFLGLGTNLGDREMNLVTARDFLMKHGVLVVGQSEVRETEPLGGLDQPMYLNQVIECQSDHSPEDLLVVCKQVEGEMGRLAAPVWDSRVIDVDILYYGDLEMKTADLTIPHPGNLERDFVVEGMRDLTGS